MDSPNIIPFDASERAPKFSANPMNTKLLTKASEKIEDPQILVNVVSRRVAQLSQGRAPLVDTVPSMGAADIALTEIIEGKVVIAEPSSDTDSE